MSKKAAKNHKEKEKEKDAEPVKAQYKHVPTHAAFDALSGSPASWSHGDRPKIREQNKRRSELAMSRTGSSLSTVTMNAATNIQKHPLPRNSSYSSYNPTWFDRGGDLNYSFERSDQPAKRQKPSRGHSYHDSGLGSSTRPSPLASNVQSEGVSPAMSSGNSTSSHHSSENLEMPRNVNRQSMRPQPIVYAEQDIFDKLHKSTNRKLGEAPLHDSPLLFPRCLYRPQWRHRKRSKRSVGVCWAERKPSPLCEHREEERLLI
ncbi:hypothetical protein D0Z07_3268 [Hyphodiscus hymeniophilus]|uniref:Uncharacterized protein n=1 Tax=Hyphodiscus hymeniophilus TaxID=353542 RepID=A0A9P6VLK7_9HELO|nr:hypothetical protein D0Z07_3268 [Hyphodiscus hymeniophilus]